jgi:hypothetical protein
MKVSPLVLFAIAILPTLSFARLRPHFIKRDAIENTPSNVIQSSSVDDDQGDCSSTAKVHKKGHQKHTVKTQPVDDGNNSYGGEGAKNDFAVPPPVDDGNQNGINYNAGLPRVKPTPTNNDVNNNANSNSNSNSKGGTDTKSSSSKGSPDGNPSYGSDVPSPKTGPTSAGGLIAANTFRPDFILGVAVRSDQLDGRLDNCILPNANAIVPEYEL